MSSMVTTLTRRAKIQDVAEAAGVAIKTVSRVLNNEPNVREGTRERVLEAVRRLNYHPSPSARSLAGRRSNLIGLFYENPSANYLVDVQHGATARCRESKYQLLTHQVTVQSSEIAEVVLGLVDQTHVDGVILTPPLSKAEPLISALERRNLPFARVAPDVNEHPSPYSYMDDEAAARDMTTYLISLGHQRIGFVVGHPDHVASAQRLRGYKAALKTHRIRFDPQYVKQGQFVFESGLAAGRQLLAMREPPTAIFASNDDMAAGVLMAAHSMGITVPDKLSVAGFDDTYIARAVWPPLTTIHQPTHALAYTATDLLLQTLRTGISPPPVRLEYTLVVRASTGVCPP